MERLEIRIDELTTFLDHYRPSGPHPVLWVGPGASMAAGYPSPEQVEAVLRRRLPETGAAGNGLAEAFIDRFSEADFRAVLQQEFGKPRRFIPLHEAIARLAGAGVCPWIVTTNQDRLLEGALGEAGVPFVVQSLEDNFSLQAMNEVHLVKLLGDVGDWESAVLASLDREGFERSFPRLARQLDLALRTRPVVFAGCRMDDPRLLGWLRGLSEKERRGLFASRAVLTQGEWERLPADVRDLLGSARLKPILVPDDAGAERIFLEAARRLAPLDPLELVFEVSPGTETWTTVGPTPESEPHSVPNPLLDPGLRSLLKDLRISASRPVLLDRPDAKREEESLLLLAGRISERLTPVLLSEEARRAVLRRIAQVDRGRARLTIRVRDSSPLGDLALALPWELLAPRPGTFAVQEGELDLVREAVVDGAPELPPPAPLKVAVTIAAPEDQTALRYEDEAFRLYAALSSLGQKVAFADLGGLDDLIEVVAAEQAGVVHFSGHGLPGQLAFENEKGLTEKVTVAELMHRLRVALLKSNRPESFPQLFFLASCHGASGTRLPPELRGGAPILSREVDEDLPFILDQGPSTAAVLHRGGFVQVVGYFGPVGDELYTRAEVAFYSALARCETTLQALTEARATLAKPVEPGGRRIRFPLAWSQLALYHRGPDRPLALPGEPAVPPKRRQVVEVSGLPVLEHGFVGRRALQHRIRRKLDGRRLIVLQGLGGLGKTALASHLLTRILAPDPRDQLVLRCLGLEGDPKPVEKLLLQAKVFGASLGIEGWDEEMKGLQKSHPDPVASFVAVVRRLRRARPGLVIYADNVEALQVGPAKGDPRALGSWRPEAGDWWRAMESLADTGTVLASTRYAWEGIDPEAWVPIDPMSRADSFRLIDSFEELAKLPHDVRLRLAEQADGHPRTIEHLEALVAGRRRSLPLGSRPADPWAELVEPVLPEHASRISADLLLEELWRRLSEDARRHAGALSVLEIPAPWEVVSALGSSATTDELIRASLLTLHRERAILGEEWSWLDRWGFHSLIRDFILEQPDARDDEEIHKAAGRAYARFITSAGGSGVLWSDQLNAVLHFFTAGLGDEAWPLTGELIAWLFFRGSYREALDFLELCEPGGTTGDQLAQVLTFMAEVRIGLGERGDALWDLLERAQGLAISKESKFGALFARALLCESWGRLEEAEACLRKAQELLGELDPEGQLESTLLGALARIRIAQEKYEEAAPLVGQVLSLIEEQGLSMRPDSAVTLSSLAQFLVLQGNIDEPVSLLRRVLRVQESELLEDHPSLAITLLSLARLLLVQHKMAEGEEVALRALEIARKVGPRNLTAGMALAVLAQAQAARGKAEAPATAREALAILQEFSVLEHPWVLEQDLVLRELLAEGIAKSDRFLALARGLETETDPLTRIATLERMIALLRSSSFADRRIFRIVLSRIIGLLAIEYLKNDRRADARLVLEEAIMIGEEINDPERKDFTALLELIKAFDLWQESLAIGDQEQILSAIEYFELSIPRLRKWNDPVGLWRALGALGNLYARYGRGEEAVSALKEALAMAEREGSEDTGALREMLAEAEAGLAEVGW